MTDLQTQPSRTDLFKLQAGIFGYLNLKEVLSLPLLSEEHDELWRRGAFFISLGNSPFSEECCAVTEKLHNIITSTSVSEAFQGTAVCTTIVWITERGPGKGLPHQTPGKH